MNKELRLSNGLFIWFSQDIYQPSAIVLMDCQPYTNMKDSNKDKRKESSRLAERC